MQLLLVVHELLAISLTSKHLRLGRSSKKTSWICALKAPKCPGTSGGSGEEAESGIAESPCQAGATILCLRRLDAIIAVTMRKWTCNGKRCRAQRDAESGLQFFISLDRAGDGWGDCWCLHERLRSTLLSSDDGFLLQVHRRLQAWLQDVLDDAHRLIRDVFG
eukprot:symbB.v1.2.003973.t1/scaffold170.1/size288889/19